MRFRIRQSIVTVVLLTFISAAFFTGAVAEPTRYSNAQQMTEPSPTDTFIDVLFYRPVGLVLIPLGTALFIISLPFSATGGNVSSAFDNLVVAPAKYTFCRPLGDI